MAEPACWRDLVARQLSGFRGKVGVHDAALASGFVVRPVRLDDELLVDDRAGNGAVRGDACEAVVTAPAAVRRRPTW